MSYDIMNAELSQIGYMIQGRILLHGINQNDHQK